MSTAIMEGNWTVSIQITHAMLSDTMSELLEIPSTDTLPCVKIRCVCVYMRTGVAYYIHLHYYS